MKKLLSAILILTLILGCVFALSSCKKDDKDDDKEDEEAQDQLSGTYVLEEEGISVFYTFEGNQFAGEMKMGDTVVAEIEGTYKIDDDKITFTYEDDGEELEEECDFEKGTGYIKLDGEKYEKQ